MKLFVVPLVIVLTSLLAVVGIGCCKATGGGFLLCEEGPIKVTFGFTAQATEVKINEDIRVLAKGKFQLIDHSDKTKVHGTFKELCVDEPLEPNVFTSFDGKCFVNGEGPYKLHTKYTDEGEPGWSNGDWITVEVFDAKNMIHSWGGEIDRGNIQVHECKGNGSGGNREEQG